MRPLKVTLVAPRYPNIWEPLWAGYLVSYCQANFSGKIDFSFFHGNFNSERTILDECYLSDVVAFSATTPTYQTCCALASKIKNNHPEVKTVIGGWHVTSLLCVIGGSEIELNSSLKPFDYIIKGEGETAFLKVLGYVWDGIPLKRILEGSPTIINNLWWPDRQFIVQEKFLNLCERMCGERIASIQTVRGCIHNCKMCGENCMSDGNVRFRPVDDSLDEIEYLGKRYKIKKVKMVDATWCHNRTYINDFCNRKIERGVTVKWDCMVHAALVERKHLELMKKANCETIMVGVESGSQEILNDIKKGVTVEKIKAVFAWAKEIGLKRRAFFILGTPLETPETVEQTKQLVREIQPDVVGMTILCPYPGTAYYDHDRFKDVDWSRADEYSNDFWCTENFTNVQLKQIQEDFCNEFKHHIADNNKKVIDNRNCRKESPDAKVGCCNKS